MELAARGGPARLVLKRSAEAFDECMEADDLIGAALMAPIVQGARLQSGDMAGCQAEAGRLAALADDLGRRDLAFLLSSQATAVALATEHLGSAEEAVQALAAGWRAVSPMLVGVTRLFQLWYLHRERLTLAPHEAILRSTLEGPNRPGLASLLVACLLEQGRLEEARELLAPVPGDLSAMKFDWARNSGFALVVDLAVDLQLPLDLDPIRSSLAGSAGEVAMLAGSMLALGRVDRFLGRLEWLAGDLDAAVHHLLRARNLDRDSGLGLAAAWAARDEAVVRRRRGAAGDEEVAVPLLDTALRTAKRHGSVRLARAVQEQF
jgi:hypothetical protein